MFRNCQQWSLAKIRFQAKGRSFEWNESSVTWSFTFAIVRHLRIRYDFRFFCWINIEFRRSGQLSQKQFHLKLANLPKSKRVIFKFQLLWPPIPHVPYAKGGVGCCDGYSNLALQCTVDHDLLYDSTAHRRVHFIQKYLKEGKARMRAAPYISQSYDKHTTAQSWTKKIKKIGLVKNCGAFTWLHTSKSASRRAWVQEL